MKRENSLIKKNVAWFIIIIIKGATAVDALANGYRVILIDDCCRGVDMRDIEKTKNNVMMNNGVIVESTKVSHKKVINHDSNKSDNDTIYVIIICFHI